MEGNGGDTSVWFSARRNTYATTQIAIRNIWRASSRSFPHSSQFCHLGCKGNFSRVWLFLRFRSPGCVVGAWLIRGLVGNGERRPMRLTFTGTLAEKGNVLSEAARGPHRPAGSDVNPPRSSFLGILLRFSFTFFPTPSKGGG